MKKLPTLILIMMLVAFSCTSPEGGITPTLLTCEYMPNPTVVDIPNPRLAWVNEASEGDRNQIQTAWQVRVASSPEKLVNPDLWDSDKVISDHSNRIIYRGSALKSRQECFWQVRVWDRDGKVSEWSDPAMWRMGLLNKTDWEASWIGAPWQGEEALPKPPGGPDARPPEFGPPAPMLRKAFTVDKEIEKAMVYTTGLGYFKFFANGKKISGDELVPNQTNYSKRPGLLYRNIPVPDDFTKYKVMYLAYDITEDLAKGENVIASMLGNGFYNPAKFWTMGYGTPRFIAQLHLEYTDGTSETIVTDESWKIAKGPIQMDMVYYGEYYDAREEQPGWNAPGFDDSNWSMAANKAAPTGDLVAHTAYTDKVMKKIQPVSLEKDENGDYLVDFGVEISGRLRLNDVTGPAGHKTDIEYICNTYSGDNSYIFRGEGPENYASSFNWFVFSSVKIKNWPGELTPEMVTAEMVHTEIPETAVFETSNPLFNKINEIWRRSQVDNMHGGIASDCPHRERSAYTGDGQVACPTVILNYDSRNFYYKWIADIREAQVKSTGYVPNGAPWQPGCGGGVAWGAAIHIMPWEFYQHYGDLDMLEDNYNGMKGYMGYMKQWITEDGTMHSQRKDLDGNVLKWFNLGEWAGLEEMPSDEFVHTFYYWYCADITAKVAAILGFDADAGKYARIAADTYNAFHRKFYQPEPGTYGNYGANVLALKMGVPPENYENVLSALKKNIEENDGHLDTGIFGTRFFFEMLAENGMNQLAYEAINKTTYPGFWYTIEEGATTTWEHWDGHGSQNHPMFGGGLVWFYRNLAGMQTDPQRPGYKHIVFRPQPVEEMEFVRYSNLTPYGTAGIEWENDAGGMKIKITVPVGADATLYFPLGEEEKIFEGKSPVETIADLQSVEYIDDFAIIKAGSGTYSFVRR